MKKVLLFGGTTESHELADFLLDEGCAVTLSVTSQYAADFIKPAERLKVKIGRMSTDDMAKFISEQEMDFVIDATHPYAAEATANIKQAAKLSGVKYLRFLRGESDTDGFACCSDVAQAAQLLTEAEGNILIATGSKELEKYAVYPELIDRCVVRVLPTAEAIEKCARLGFKMENVIAMQGPFSEQMNAAVFDKYDIKVMVTKDGGKAGGFAEKAAAAKHCGVAVIVVRRPEDKGLTMSEIKAEIKSDLI